MLLQVVAIPIQNGDRRRRGISEIKVDRMSTGVWLMVADYGKESLVLKGKAW